MQPTQAYLLRLQAEQAARERAMMEGQPVPREQRPPRPTRPRSPKLHTSQKAARNLQGDFSRMSSTSRELQLLQEEKMRVEVERLKIWEYHERTKAQRPPTDVHQRSTKQLTIPMSPHLEVGHRDRCFLHHQEDDDGFDCNGDHELPHQHIRPETLVSREFELPTRTHGHHLERTQVPESPHLQTAARAAVRNPVPRVQTPEKESPVNHAHSKVGGLTKPISPNLATDRRAQFAATHRKPIEVVDSDEEELAKQFHAKPLNRRILQSKPSSKAGVKSRPSLTKPISPRFATHARSASRQTAAEKAAAERGRRERERRARLRSRTPRDQGPPPSHQNVPHHPVVPHTPQLMGLARHKQYQEEFQKRLQEEEMELRRQREFKAKPIRTAAPLKFEGSRRPLTEVIPFQLESERMHERALEKLQQKRLEEEEQLRAAAQFKATPMPAIHDPEFQLKPSSRPLTRCAAPMLASDRRAAERAAFDAAERERRAMEQANKQRMEEEERRREEAKIRRLRREKMVFHARPAPQPKPFELKPTNKALTEPESPFLMTRAQAHRVPSNQAA
ncbi:TPA: hypothetical protein N0F65_003473 [Lagenidium giganteum]|uniref:TPX2 C-terminal domain-containing protein n=1 Tax=Lagenidium giganteum TaxID=4803 RepID=A0AAV2YN57_9STRA|nr:TPA: hypothetical protein N0F65_003473 [Lagenidium giganteum]